MHLLRLVGLLREGVDSFPVFLTITDIRPTAPRHTDVVKAGQYCQSKGVRLVMLNHLFQILFNTFGTILYEANIEEQERWTPAEYNLATFNFGTLSSSAVFQDIFFNDQYFGTRRPEFLKSSDSGCDYCFWMIHYRFTNN